MSPCRRFPAASASAPSEGTWAISSYMLAAAIMQPLDRLDRRAASAKCAPSSPRSCCSWCSPRCAAWRPACRCWSARGSSRDSCPGPMMSVAQAILLRNYPIERRGMAIALWAMVIIDRAHLRARSSAAGSPTISRGPGCSTSICRWAPSRRRLLVDPASPRIEATCKLPIDVVGLMLLVVGVGSLQFMLDNGNEKDWFNSPVIVAAALVSLVSIAFLDSLGTDRQASGHRSASVQRSATSASAPASSACAYFALSGRQHHLSAVAANHGGLYRHLGGTRRRAGRDCWRWSWRRSSAAT